MKNKIVSLEFEKKQFLVSFLKTLEPKEENNNSKDQSEEEKKDENHCGTMLNFTKKKRKKLGKIYQEILSKREKLPDQKKKFV